MNHVVCQYCFVLYIPGHLNTLKQMLTFPLKISLSQLTANGLLAALAMKLNGQSLI